MKLSQAKQRHEKGRRLSQQLQTRTEETCRIDAGICTSQCELDFFCLPDTVQINKKRKK